MPIKIGDIEMKLPFGMYLHKSWQRKRFHAICKLTETNAYIARKNALVDHEEAIREEKLKLQKKMMDQGEKGKVKIKKIKSVPVQVQSSKHIMAEKKVAQSDMDIDKGKKK